MRVQREELPAGRTRAREHHIYTRKVEDRAYRDESKVLAVQLKTSQDRVQTLQHSLQVAQAELSKAREQRATALGE